MDIRSIHSEADYQTALERISVLWDTSPIETDDPQELGRLDQLMDEEGEVIVTKHGKPIARLLPLKGSRAMPNYAPLRAQMPILKIPSSRLLHKDRDER